MILQFFFSWTCLLWIVQLVSCADISEFFSTRRGILPVQDEVAPLRYIYRRQNATEFCKIFPGDKEWPSEAEWAKLNETIGGALIRPVPHAAVCHESWPQYDAEACQELINTWGNYEMRVKHPTDIIYQYFQGTSCEPSTNPSTPCTRGGTPEYVVNVSSAAQISSAIKFAKEKNVRLVVKNTGHDVSGKSTGAGSLSIWTHNLKKIEYLPDFKNDYYSGPAMRVGAGVSLYEYYTAADVNNVTAVGGECDTVGVAGGYLSGGGHSPSGGLFGMGADQVVELTAVLPDGRDVHITSTSEPELFWAFRGGGGSTFGVITSVTVKVHPKIPITVSRWAFGSSTHNITNETFWEAVRAYLDNIPAIADSGSQAFSAINSMGELGYTFRMTSFFAANHTVEQYDALMKPLFDRLKVLGVEVEQNTTFHNEYYGGWSRAFPKLNGRFNESKPVLATGSRLIPRRNFEDPRLKNKTFEVFKEVAGMGYPFIFYTQKNEAPKGVDNAINLAYRDSAVFLIVSAVYTKTSSIAEINSTRNAISNVVVPKFKAITPGGGTYMNEADCREPDWQQNFFGSNYPRLLALKKKLDPDGIFWAKTAVGSEGWYIKDDNGLPEVQTGRLCRKMLAW
ncbi:FAD-binding domain-containing protein [Zopfia rhizophila CBS 207.26]|uniref:FAD-binding domain-containing protein n=1 Tax=Zopfia rhizophila CBS 207.26 TaxID=1314779 RepID=A0A6A6EYB6_9PEZI|nr:FAD-binding domain-containing protein [Zopfia rhizophila CBS 207.26]